MIKKIFKFAFLFIIGLFVVGAIITAVVDDPGSTDATVVEEVDSFALAKQQRIADSIEAVKIEQKKIALEKLQSFKKTSDEFKGSSFYKHSLTPTYIDENFVFPYISESKGTYWLRFKMQYAAEDWLFIQKAIFLIDGTTYELLGDWQRDNNTTIWEWVDIPVGESELIILELIAGSETTKVRYQGRQYHDDRTLTSREKTILKETIEIYKALKDE